MNKRNFNYLFIPRQRGLSLLELMVALALGLLIVAGVSAFFLQSKRNFLQDELITRMQENARAAMDVLVHDLQMTAFLGGMTDGGLTIQKDAGLGASPAWNIGTDCGAGWAYDPITALGYTADADAAKVNTDFPCIDASELYNTTSTNILAIKRVRGAPSATAAPGGVYLRTNGMVGILYREPAMGTLPSGTGWADWAYQASVYFIGIRKDANGNNLTDTTGANVPTLYRKYLRPGAVPTMQTEAGGIAEGIESFRIQFGVDTNRDGVADQYLSNPTPAQMQLAVSARIYILARSTGPDPAYTNTKHYNLGDLTGLEFNDNYYRRVYTTTVVLRNPANMLRLN